MKYAIAGGIAEEVLVNIRTVAAFCKEFVEMKRYTPKINFLSNLELNIQCGMWF